MKRFKRARRISQAQYRVLVWFCKEVSKAVFLEVLALTFVPSFTNVVNRPPTWIILVGSVISLTLLWVAVKLAKKGESS